MGTVVLHAGMGKTGSTSIQAWLAEDAARLRRLETCLLVLRETSDGRTGVGLRLTPYTSGSADSNLITMALTSDGGENEACLDSFFAQLDAAATRSRVVVLSAEGMAEFFYRALPAFLSRLDELGDRHRVRVAYYVRPQHTALEAAWRQWGFRSGLPPSQFLEPFSWTYDYFETYLSICRHAPSVSFEPRPFRRDLLDGGDPAADFARRFLDGVEADPPPESRLWANRGLPLEVVNAMRHAPPDLLFSSVHDNEKLDLIKTLLSDLDAPETERTAKSRLILQAYCHAVFERGNSRLIDALGWRTDSFVPPVEGDLGEGESRLRALDDLWEPRASAIELQALYCALDGAVSPLLDKRPAPEARRQNCSPPKARELALAKSKDLALAQSELARLRVSRTWRLSRLLARLSAVLRRQQTPKGDPIAAVSKRLRKAATRVEGSEAASRQELGSEYVEQPPERAAGEQWVTGR